LAEYKTSQSAIGFVVEPKYVAVANYDNKTVEILDRDLRHLQTIKTDSKNVGIKVYKNILVFALMDKDELCVCDNTADKDSTPKFETIKKFTSVGEVPFDAMIRDNLYIVGFFNSPWIGVVNLDNMSYKKISFTKEESQPVLKVPHFGFWSIGDTNIFVPSVGEASVMAFDTNFKFVKKIKTQGLPVFTSLSPDKKLLAVTFSGKEFPIVQIIDVNTLKIVQTIDFGGTVLHVRWSEDSPLLYVSVNTKNELQLIDTTTWQKKAEIPVRQPSGIFLYHTPDTRDMK
jgi:protein NirF